MLGEIQAVMWEIGIDGFAEYRARGEPVSPDQNAGSRPENRLPTRMQGPAWSGGMIRMLGRASRIARGVLTAILAFAAMFLLGVYFLLGPIAVIAETLDLVRMDSRTVGTVRHVERTEVNGRISKVLVHYRFLANGNVVESTRLFPGFLGKGSTGTTARLAENFRAGDRCQVSFDASDPSRCSLHRGWFHWSVSLTLVAWGLTISKVLSREKAWTRILAKTGTVYGALLVFVGPAAVLLDQIGYHAVVALAISIGVIVHAVTWKQRGTWPVSA